MNLLKDARSDPHSDELLIYIFKGCRPCRRPRFSGPAFPPLVGNTSLALHASLLEGQAGGNGSWSEEVKGSEEKGETLQKGGF